MKMYLDTTEKMAYSGVPVDYRMIDVSTKRFVEDQIRTHLNAINDAVRQFERSSGVPKQYLLDEMDALESIVRKYL